jgi:hypothetical protein
MIILFLLNKNQTLNRFLIIISEKIYFNFNIKQIKFNKINDISVTNITHSLN